jgi:hypothetical protein
MAAKYTKTLAGDMDFLLICLRKLLLVADDIQSTSNTEMEVPHSLSKQLQDTLHTMFAESS